MASPSQSREELQKLLAEAESGHADFSAVVVYDVSRWGRFQDVDQSAYHEYVCRRAGRKCSLLCRAVSERRESDLYPDQKREAYYGGGIQPGAVGEGVCRAVSFDFTRNTEKRNFCGDVWDAHRIRC